MERSSSSSRSSGKSNGGKDNKGKQQQQSRPPPQQMPPFMGQRPPQMPYPPGAFPFPGAAPMGTPPDPNQQRLLQIQIRQQQLQLQQMQQQQQAAQAKQAKQQAAQAKQAQAKQQAAQQKLQQKQQQQHPFSSFTTTTTPHAKQPTSAKVKAPSPLPRKTAPPPPPPEHVKQWLLQCDWKDKTIHMSRQLFGGNNINLFNKATAAAQRIKKQRARQITSNANKKRAAAETTTTTASTTHPEQELPKTQEEMKREILNPRTAKKLKTEFQQGAVFCKSLYENVQSIMRELDPTGVSVPPSIHRLSAAPRATPSSSRTKTTKAATSHASNTAKAKSKASTTQQAAPAAALQQPSTASGVQGSGLRKNRRRKHPTYHLDVSLSEHDASGKRLFTKKEHNLRIAEVLRFRGLRAGDYVAARVSSRDLWILARVVQDYPPINMDANEFLKLTDAKRDALFRNKVIVKDAEEKAEAAPIAVSRQLVLPLPRTYTEAAEWGTRLKKGLRIYAMYPHTTSLYVATVVDNTAYCRGDDDIIVVEFDEDERDATGALPKCHIPARFTVMIPREYQTTKKKASSSAAKQAPSGSKQTKSTSKKATTAAAAPSDDQSDPALNNMLSEMDEAMGDFDALVDFSPSGGV